MARGYLFLALIAMSAWWAIALMLGGCASTATMSDGSVIKAGFGNDLMVQHNGTTVLVKPNDLVTTAGKQLSSEALQHSEPIARYGIDKLTERMSGQ
jgi:hypothetical protein